MDYTILTDIWTKYTMLKYFVFFLIGYLTFKLLLSIYEVVTSSSGIHHVNLERTRLQMCTSYNPFTFDAEYDRASYDGIKCFLKSEHECYVQAFWGLPITALFEFLDYDWQSMVNSMETEIPSPMISRCLYSENMFVLHAGEEETVVFELDWNFQRDNVTREGKYLRKVYPLVVLMLLKEKDDVKENRVVAMANAIHIPDDILTLSPHLIGEYVSLGSGCIGQVKKIFLSTSPESDENGEGYGLCIACYHRPVSMVYLPCRHACVCRACFTYLCQKCPICRASSSYYFELDDIGGGEEEAY